MRPAYFLGFDAARPQTDDSEQEKGEQLGIEGGRIKARCLLEAEQDAVDYAERSACAVQSFVSEPIDIRHVADNADSKDKSHDFGKRP